MVEIIISIIAVAFAIWAMVSVAKSKMSKDKKVGWFAVVILIPILGPLLYYFIGK